jgi:hypothetical protein
MLFQNLKVIGEELSEICVLFCKYIYIFIYIDSTYTAPRMIRAPLQGRKSLGVALAEYLASLVGRIDI